MTASTLESLQRMLAAGRDSALLRYGLGNEHLKSGDAAAAIEHLAQAVAMAPDYSAAWKLLGKAREAGGDPAGALDAWRSGILAAEARGDLQAAREMAVFARRAARALGGESPPGD